MALARHRVEHAQQVEVEGLEVGHVRITPSFVRVMMAVRDARWKRAGGARQMRGEAAVRLRRGGDAAPPA
jgi:hypothetical protein